MTALTLPDDIVELVIDTVQSCGPLAALFPCSLISRQWLPRTRHHIFSIVALILASKDDKDDNATAFIQLLDSPLSRTTLIPYVRSLSLENRVFDTPALFTPRGLLAMLAQAGIQPARMILSGTISQVVPTVSEPSASFAASVTELKFVLNDKVDLAPYICAFRSLQSLSVHCTEPGLILPIALSHALPSTLHSLRVDGFAPAILDWMRSASPAPHLRTILVCRGDSKEFWDHLNPFLGTVSGIESLTFIACGTSPEFYSGTSIPTLRHLGLEYRMNPLARQVTLFYHGDQRFNDTTEIVPTIRAFRACVGLRTLCVSVSYLDDNAKGQLQPWGNVDQTLLETWPKLESVEVVDSQKRTICVELATELRANMPLCEGRGILRVNKGV
ncbi:hypothetical protein C8F04DRAFT_1119225 [Mycena alexandri]|uniref:F-box domain-containing protein n=1 Tax=Mycena alexandri TaxID=1745969 RepID=A0AAD6SIV2_9AGAR|nr:hypothetical protein C8F04DRAFT_1119225 [Mycena alexandri]